MRENLMTASLWPWYIQTRILHATVLVGYRIGGLL